MKKKLLILLYIIVFSLGYGEVINGKIYEKFTKDGIEGVYIIIEGTQTFAITDSEGNFKIKAKAGDNLIAIKKKYKKISKKINEQNIILEMEKKDILYGDVVTITATKPTVKVEEETSKIELSGEELKSVPQSYVFSDVTNGLNSLPGVQKSSEFSSLLYIRGGEPYETLNVLNGVPLVWSKMWGGNLSIYNQSIIENINLYSGGFSSRYSEAMSGVLEVNYKEGNTKKWHGEATLSAETSLQMDGPISIFGKKAGLILAYRRSFYDLIMNNIKTEDGDKLTYPYFQDFYIGYNQKITKKDKLRLWLSYGNEGMKYKFDAADSEHENSKPGDGFDYAESLLNYTADYTRVLNKNSKLRLLASNARDNLDHLESIEPLSTGTGKVKQSEWSFLGEYTLETKKNTLKLGSGLIKYKLDELDFHYEWYMYNEDEGDFVTKYFDQGIDEIQDKDEDKGDIYYSYIEDEFRMKKLFIKPGVNISYSGMQEKNNYEVDPRITLRYKLNPNTNIKFATGKYSQHPMDYNITSNNSDIKSSKTYHYIAGIEKKFNSNYKIKTEIYYKDMRDLIVEDPDEEDIFEGEGKNIYKNIGEGFSKGIEVFLQKKNTEKSKFDGWASYTYAITKKKINTKKKTEWFYPYQDQRHTLNFTGNYYLIKNKKRDLFIRGKLDYYSGRPTQDYEIVPITVNENGVDTVVYIKNPIKDKYTRLDGYFRADLEIENTRKYKNFSLGSFFQIVNITNSKNSTGKNVAVYTGEESDTLGFARMFYGGIKI